MNADVSDDGTATAGEASNDAAAEQAVLDTLVVAVESAKWGGNKRRRAALHSQVEAER
jgi:hypothetical protein